DARDAEIAARSTDADGGGRPEEATGRTGREYARRAEIQVDVVAVAEQSRSRLAVICRLELQLRGKEKRVLLRELVGSPVDGKLEAVVLCFDGVEGEPP